MAESPRTPEPVADWATDFDHFDPSFINDPYPIYADLRDRCPVAHSERYGGMNVLTRLEDVAAAAHDTATFTSRRTIVSSVPTDRRGIIMPPINLDPPDHTGPRRAMLPFFNPERTSRWAEPIHEICERLLDEIEAGGADECDVAQAYSRHVPGEVTALMLGVPISEAEKFRGWIHDLIELGPVDPEVERRTTHEMLDYMAALVAERRAHPEAVTGDAASYLIETQAADENLTDDDLVKMLFLLLIAGIDTTWSAIGSSLLHLAGNPADRDRLVAEPELIPTATEEFLRAYSPVYIGRIATADTELSGCPIKQGEWVVLNFASANRDPEAFEAPEDVLIDRERNRHAAFGLGAHRCLGSNLARLEMNIAIERWLARFPRFALTDPTAVTYAAGQVRGPRNIPVTLR